MLVVLAGIVLIGGIKRLGAVAGKLVPFMAIAYIGAGRAALIVNYAKIPEAFGLIFSHAFSPIAATGGFAGAAVWAAMQFGVARGVFSNEAGLGSAPIAHAAAQTKGPVSQGLVAMLGPFIDTILVCSFTALVILTSGAWTGGETGAALTGKAFELALPGVGHYVMTFALTLFAFTTILGWSYHSERSLEYLFGVRIITPFRVVWCLAIFVGATIELAFVWLVADTLNALMAIPNLIALALLCLARSSSSSRQRSSTVGASRRIIHSRKLRRQVDVKQNVCSWRCCAPRRPIKSHQSISRSSRSSSRMPGGMSSLAVSSARRSAGASAASR